MNNPLVSVIVPIYKTEVYLDQCVQSIVGQSYSNLEIILLDDGSPDRCPEMCDLWAEKDSRIRVVHKANAGLSDTRNVGMSLATGKYMIMPDSDDYLAPEAIEVMVKYALKYQAQCVIGGYKRLLRDGTLVEHSGTDSVLVCNGRQEVEKHIQRRLIGAQYRGMPHLSQSCWTKLYDRNLVEKMGLCFFSTKEIGSEDFYFNICFFEKVETAVIIPENNYIYRDNSQSITNTFNPERTNCQIRLYKKLKEERVLSDVEEYQQMLSANILGYISVHIKQIVASNITDKIQKIIIVMEDPTVREMLSHCRFLKINFPLNLFCFLMKYRLKYSLYYAIKIFLKLNASR